MHAWTLFILRRRRAVLALWCAALVLGVIASTRLPAFLTNHFALPGTDSERAETILETRFGQRTVGAFTLVVQTADETQDLADIAEAAGTRAAAALPGGSLAGVSRLGPRVAVAQIVSALTSAEAKTHTAAMRTAIGPIDGAKTYLTGFAAAEHDMDPILQADLYKGEVLIALPLAVALLAWTFGTLAFVLPLVFALFTIPATLGLVFLFAQAMELTTYVTNLVSLIGLGMAVDYSLLMVHRFREEALAGATTDEAIVRTMDTAGRAVVFSGTAVGIGLALLVWLPLPFLRGFGVGGLLIPMVSVLGALTLLPALLSWVGRPLDGVRLVPAQWLAERMAIDHGFWPRLAFAIMRRPVLVATGSTLALLLMSVPLLALELGPGSREGLPRSVESIQGLDIVSAAIGAGATAPTTIAINTGHDGGSSDVEVVRAIDRLKQALAADAQVAAVYHVPDLPQFVDLSGRHVLIKVAGREDFGTPQSGAFVDRLRHVLVPAAAFPPRTTVVVGGAPAAGRDFLYRVRTWFPPLVAAILVVTYSLLLRAFRSLLLPLKAIVLNLLSIGAAGGLTVAVFRWGWGVPLGLIAQAQISAWIPVMVFAMLFGLSMDYEVFIVCRMREHWDRGASNEQAVAFGLGATGRLVTSAGLIMGAAFAGFVAGSVVELQQFGFALATSVLIDVTIVRALLLPAAMKLFGRWNWYLPRPVARILRTPP